MKTLCVMAVIFLLFAGCRGPGPSNFKEQLQQMEALSKFARDNDMALSINIGVTGRAGFYATQEFGLNTGIIAQATLIANSGDSDPQQ